MTATSRLPPPAADAAHLLLAGLSVRAAAQAARREGLAVTAVDCFGDADTLAATQWGDDEAAQAPVRWHRLGCARRLQPDDDHWQRAWQHSLRGRRPAQALLPGAGFEARPDLLRRVAPALPLLGTPLPQQVRAHDPWAFAALLDQLDLPHPALAPVLRGDDAGGWLVKRSGACGGAHVRPARRGETALPPGCYAQRWQSGLPYSVCLLADGERAHWLGVNRQLLPADLSAADAPPAPPSWRFSGAIGPVPLPAAARAQLRPACDALVAALGLRGLCSVDFLLDGQQVWLLEVNPRLPATLALYPQARPISAHLALCGLTDGRTPLPPEALPEQGQRAFAVVSAPRQGGCDAALALALAHTPGCADLPHAGQAWQAGEPVCTVEVALAPSAALPTHPAHPTPSTRPAPAAPSAPCGFAALAVQPGAAALGLNPTGPEPGPELSPGDVPQQPVWTALRRQHDHVLSLLSGAPR